LGLGDERSRDLDYLLEDEAPRSHGRLYLALILLIVSGAVLAWQWRRDSDYWSRIVKAVNSSVGISPAPATAPPPDATAAAAPAAPVEPTANPAPPETQTATGEAAKPPADESSAGGGAPPASAALTKPVNQAQQPDDGTPEPAAKTSSPASSQGSEPEATEPVSKDTQIATKTPIPKGPSPKPSPTAPASTFEDRLVADGERYLYGRGVPEDCNRAQRNLQIAARQANPKAETLLGAMYATGHCMGRDLPTAYRWFAKALHGDPSNSRVQRDLEVLWKQMTPEERLLAMKGQ
jgi:hypothetical protein